jgi:hypothetical protein
VDANIEEKHVGPLEEINELNLKDEESIFFQNVCVYLQGYMMLQPRRPQH